MRGDDAAGLEAVGLWQRHHASTAARSDVRVSLIEEPGLELLSVLEGMDAAILVDAVRSGNAAGTLHRVGLESLAAILKDSSFTHSWGVAQVLRLRTALEPQSDRQAIRILGIEAARVEIGAGLSDAVRGVMPAAVEAIEDELTAFL
jgi:hydrogenase maturation protease